MSHAEKCPVCQGSGKVEVEIKIKGKIEKAPQLERCHGCEGKGWITVQDPTPYPPTCPHPCPMPHGGWPWSPTLPWYWNEPTWSTNLNKEA